MKSMTNPSASHIKALETMLDSVIKKHALNPDTDLKIRLQIAQDLTTIIQTIIQGKVCIKLHDIIILKSICQDS